MKNRTGCLAILFLLAMLAMILAGAGVIYLQFSRWSPATQELGQQ